MFFTNLFQGTGARAAAEEELKEDTPPMSPPRLTTLQRHLFCVELVKRNEDGEEEDIFELPCLKASISYQNTRFNELKASLVLTRQVCVDDGSRPPHIRTIFEDLLCDHNLRSYSITFKAYRCDGNDKFRVFCSHTLPARSWYATEWIPGEWDRGSTEPVVEKITLIVR